MHHPTASSPRCRAAAALAEIVKQIDRELRAAGQSLLAVAMCRSPGGAWRRAVRLATGCARLKPRGRFCVLSRLRRNRIGLPLAVPRAVLIKCQGGDTGLLSCHPERMGRAASKLREVAWTPLALTVAVFGVLLLAWTTARDIESNFPDPILSAIGLLLTALVFVLALAQGRLHRTADAALAEARQLEATFLAAHAEHPNAVTTMDLWAQAGALKEALFTDTDSSLPRWEKRLVLSRARQPVGNWGTAGTLYRSFDILRIDRELERTADEPDAPSPRRRRYLERERVRLSRELGDTRAADQRAGITVHGYRRLRARVQVAELSVRSLVSVARVFSALMAALVVLGGIYAGWGTDLAPPPALWAALVLIALAWVYSRVVVDDINLEVSAVASALRDLSLLVLYEAEGTLGSYWEASSSGADVKRMLELRQHLEHQIDQAAQRVPGSLWLASIRGRFELVKAIRSSDFESGGRFKAHDDRMNANLLESLPAATRLLRYAASRTDDPGAALGYAKLLTLQADLLGDGKFTIAPAYFDSENPNDLRAAAHGHVQRALLLMSGLPILPRGVFGLPHRLWFTKQSYLWPEDEDSLRELDKLLLIDPERS
jgi:hypothetical protein